ncbi:MAG: efflux RND transporter permease subunit, partial [Cyanothece sp. SIO1E1]|nr:efflux RND transporter permease subunit [Cyanothece sp. SIO1E1]
MNSTSPLIQTSSQSRVRKGASQNRCSQARPQKTQTAANCTIRQMRVLIPGNPRGLDMDMLRDFVDDNIRTRLSSVPGVSAINIRGGADRQVRILVDPERLVDRELTIMDVRDAIRARNRDVSGGEIESGKRSFLLRTVGRFESVESLEGQIVDRRGDPLIRLGDVASMELDHF